MREHAGQEYIIKEIPVKNGFGIMKPAYTHWTISYALTLEGNL